MLKYQQRLIGDFLSCYYAALRSFASWRPAWKLVCAPFAGERWPLLRYWTSVSTVFCAELWPTVTALWMPSRLHPAVPLLSAVTSRLLR